MIRMIGELACLVLVIPLICQGVVTPAAGQTDYDLLRREMVDGIRLQVLLSSEQTGVSELDARILAALRAVPRHDFVPEPLRPLAYEQSPLPIGHSQNIASPFIVALMTQLAGPRADDVVFETGTGAGYHAAILSRLAAEVYSVEVIEPLAEESGARLKDLGYHNVHAKHGDGYYGWAEHAPYDAIIVKEAVDHVPPPLIDQLKPGGRLVMPLGPGRGPQILTLIHKRSDGSLTRTPILPVLFSPLQGGERT